MTESARRRTSKWDLKEDPNSFQSEIRQNNSRSVNASKYIDDHGSKSEWKSSNGNDVNDPNWSDMERNSALQPKGNSGRSRWESSHGDRAEQMDKNINRYSHDISQTKNSWGRDQRSSMSPGFDEWRRRSRSHSPKNDWSRSCRSRSRSPSHGFKRESDGRNDRIRSGSGVPAPICKDFARGRCTRGSQCRFLHQDIHDYDGRKHSGGGSADDWVSRHEKGGSSGNHIERDYLRNKPSHGHRDHYDGNGEKHEGLRNSRSSNLCNNFLKGRCYRGSSCIYVHDSASSDGHETREWANKNRDANAFFGADYKREPYKNNRIPCKFFAAGNCRNGVSCRFSHETAVQDRSEEKSRDSMWGCNVDGGNRSWGGAKWNAEAADSAHGCLEGRSEIDQWAQNLDNEDRSWGGPKSSEKAVDSDVKFQKWINDSDGGHMGDKAENKSWGGPKWTDKASDPGIMKSPQWRNHDNGVKVDVPVSQPTDRWCHILDDQNKTSGAPWSGKLSGLDRQKSPLLMADNNSGSMSVWVSSGHGELLHAVNVPSGGAKGEYKHFIGHGETGAGNHGLQSGSLQEITLPTREQNTTQTASGRRHHAPEVALQLPITENLHIQQHCSLTGNASAFTCQNSGGLGNGAEPQVGVSISEDVLPAMDPAHGQKFQEHMVNQPQASFNAEGQGQEINPLPAASVQTFDLNGPAQEMFSHTSSSQHVHTPSHVEEMIKRSDAIDKKVSPLNSGHPMAQNIVTSEQVAQITNLSASLAQIFGKGQQLPQLYATLNSHSKGLLPSHPNSAGPVAPVLASFVQSNQSIWPQRQYNPIGESINSSDISVQPPGFAFGNPVEQNKTGEQESQMPMKNIALSSATGELDGGDPSMNGCLEKPLEHPTLESKALQPVDDERAADHRTKERETALSEDMNADDRVDEEGRRNKDAKGMRMFKFALVEFVKEILKPTWKEGQMSKEAHKTIVKKVVDKVTGSVPGDHIPQTQEKIDHYLSYSKPKLSKLVQAYVEKYLKT